MKGESKLRPLLQPEPLLWLLFAGGVLAFIVLTRERWLLAEAALGAGPLKVRGREPVTDPAPHPPPHPPPEGPAPYLALLVLSAVAVAHLSRGGTILDIGDFLFLTAMALYVVGKAMLLTRGRESAEAA